MKYKLISLAAACGFAAAPALAAPQHIAAAEPFEASVLTSGLNGPWDMVWGPDNFFPSGREKALPALTRKPVSEKN